MTRERQIMQAARLLSAMTTPLYLPLLALTVLMVFSYLRMLPWGYKMVVLLLTYIFTVFLPSMLIRFYQYYHGWTPIQLSQRERRMVPYVISILCYMAGYYVMQAVHIPRFMAVILVCALMIQMACAIVNHYHKVSVHAAAIGGMTGGLVAFSVIFSFNPVWWLCLVLILAGLVGSSRMVLRQHSLHQVLIGYGIGCVLGFVMILF